MAGVKFTGPPYSIAIDQIQELYGKFFDIKLLETKDEDSDAKVLKVQSKLKHIHLLTLLKHH